MGRTGTRGGRCVPAICLRDARIFIRDQEAELLNVITSIADFRVASGRIFKLPTMISVTAAVGSELKSKLASISDPTGRKVGV